MILANAHVDDVGPLVAVRLADKANEHESATKIIAVRESIAVSTE